MNQPTPLAEALAKQCGKLQARVGDGLVPVDDSTAEAVLRAIEEAEDIVAARQALKETPVDWDIAKAELGIL